MEIPVEILRAGMLDVVESSMASFEAQYVKRKCTKGKQDFARIQLPYMYIVDDASKQIFLTNREYKFLGFTKQNTPFVKYPLTGEQHYLYNDGCKPWESKKNWEEYRQRWFTFLLSHQGYTFLLE